MPRNFAIDPQGRWLLVANQGSDSIAVFRIDPRSGSLTDSGRRLEGRDPDVRQVQRQIGPQRPALIRSASSSERPRTKARAGRNDHLGQYHPFQGPGRAGAFLFVHQGMMHGRDLSWR